MELNIANIPIMQSVANMLRLDSSSLENVKSVLFLLEFWLIKIGEKEMSNVPFSLASSLLRTPFVLF